jgi:hypothetical protein
MFATIMTKDRERRQGGGGEGIGRGSGGWGFLDGRPREEVEEAARGVADGSGGRGGPDLRRPPAAKLDADDILIDGGNSYYVDDSKRAKELTPKRIHYMDVGTS